MYAHHTAHGLGHLGGYVAHLIVASAVWHLSARLGVVGLVLLGLLGVWWIVRPRRGAR